MRREGLPVQKIAAGRPARRRSPSRSNYADLDALYAAIGENHVSAKSVAAAHRPSAARRRPRAPRSSCPPPCASRGGRPRRRQAAPVGVHVEGLDDVMVRLSRCCTPVPGDEIIGFVTRGRGVSVHRADCANAVSLSTRRTGERLIEVEWDSEHTGHVRGLHRGEGPRPRPAALRRRPGAVRQPRQHPRRRRPAPAPTASRRCASSSSSATRPPRVDAHRPSSASTASTTPTASSPARAADLHSAVHRSAWTHRYQSGRLCIRAGGLRALDLRWGKNSGGGRRAARTEETP